MKDNKMIVIKRTDSNNLDFQKLVMALDSDLKGYYKEESNFYDELNTIEKIKHVVVAYDENQNPVGCGGFKVFSQEEVEIKRMFVPVKYRGKNIATLILKALEDWCAELNFKITILETLTGKPYAIKFYEKNNYVMISNFGDYIHAENSVCFSKKLK